MNVYSFKAEDADGNVKNLEDYKGKVLLIINSATKCGFTPQYDALQEIYEKYNEDGFEILDFPCNQFGGQAPGTIKEIASFCDATFGITFPLFAKIEVNGEGAHPLFKFLVSQKGFKGFDEHHPIASRLMEKLSEADPEYASKPDIKWNFTKFLISKDGEVLERFEPTEDMYIVEQKIKALL
ncbi:MAG: glutathione peroxidase [Clostridiales bacterium]|nr:glutathione peroxidase [Clostridiales bacterium]